MERGPLIQLRAAQPYVGIRARPASEREVRTAVHRGFPELFGWLQDNAIERSGAPFIRTWRFERYLTDAASEPDWSKWRTELAYLISDGPQAAPH
jgi:hypothetical protein